MFASILCSYVLVHAPKAVSVDLPVCPVAKVLEEIGRQTGETLVVSGAVRDDFVFVHVKDLDSEILKQRLAKLVDGTWVKGNGVQTLTASDNIETQEDIQFQKNIDEWTARIKKDSAKSTAPDTLALNLNDLEKKLQDNSDPSAWQKMTNLQKELPISRLGRRLLSDLAPQLKKIKVGERLVFSQNPTSLQLGLPLSSATTIAEYQRDYTAFRDILLAKGLIDQDNERVYFGNSLSQYGSPTPSQNFFLAVTRDFDNVTAELKFWDKEGNFIMSEMIPMREYLPESKEDIASNPFKDMTQAVNPPKGAEYFQPLIAATMGRPIVWPGAKDEVITRITDFANHDPLAELPSDIFEQYAKAVNKNVIAYVPDTAIQVAFYFAFGTDTAKANFATVMPMMLRSSLMGEPNRILVEDENGLQSIRDVYLGGARKIRMPRTATTAFLKSLRLKKKFELDAFADFVKLVKYDDTLILVALYAAFAAEKKIEMPRNDDLKLVRFYGEYSQSARDKIKQGEVQTPIDQLTQKQKEILNQFLFKSNSGIQKSENAAGVAGEQFGFSDTDRYGFGIESLKNEPTFLLAKGLPRGSVAVMSMKTIDNLFVMTEFEGFRQTSARSLSSLAYDLFYKEKGFSEYYNRPQSYMISPSTALKLNVKLDVMGTMTKTLFLDEVPIDGKWGDLSTLPANVQKIINENLAKVREHMKDVQFGNGSGRTVKPPQ